MTTLTERINTLSTLLCNLRHDSDTFRKTELRHKRLLYIQDNICKALDCSSFPGNPIPFAIALADLVRECGTDSIKGDDAKRILWILMAQAYGQSARIDLLDEWAKLSSKEAQS